MVSGLVVGGAPPLCPTLFPRVMQLESGRVGILKGCFLLPPRPASRVSFSEQGI